MQIKEYLSRLHTNLSGKKIKDKIIVFESDDWGGIRIPSKSVRDKLDNQGIHLSKYPYTRYDGLETNEDIDNLANVLSQHQDVRGRLPCITMNFVLQNPDFEEIENDSFSKYHGESIEDTYRNYPASDHVLNKVKDGSLGNLFLPQYHGREHVNVINWLELLRNGHKEFRLAFDNKIFGLGRAAVPDVNFNIQATYDTLDNNYALDSLKSGAKLFKGIFGYHSKSFIANNFIWSDQWNGELKKLGVSHFQGMKYQLLPQLMADTKRKRILHHNGELNSHNQLYTVRNCEFEPSVSGFGHEKTLNEIWQAFVLGQPAIISSHRVNFTSRIDQKRRDLNLSELHFLLKKSIKKWPDMIFMSSGELEDYYRKALGINAD